MAIFKCKMCGGTLEIKAGETVATCEYCGTQQTLPRLDDERRAQMYDRANHFRRNNEFDKAEGVYEQILIEDNTDAEAYWSLVLCRYGIEYVEDPVSHKRIPTINRTQMTSVFGDENYKSALQYADIYQKDIYEKEAKAIDEIQKGILEISQKEEPFDIFICYKETDTQGRRTPDSVLANDLYHQLTKEGYKVFFSRITLEDKLGTAYEPYIFAALNSAKVMIVLGTKGEYFNAVWVKNEWKRYLALIKGGEDKVLIPAYKDMDPYDLPEDFSYLQAQDMSKLGFMQDMIHGIGKIFAQKKGAQSKIPEIGTKSNANALIKRMSIFLEDGNWEKADEYCERILDMDPENAEAYIGKILAKHHLNNPEQLRGLDLLNEDASYYRRALKSATGDLKERLQSFEREKECRRREEGRKREEREKAAKEKEIQNRNIKELLEKNQTKIDEEMREKLNNDVTYKALLERKYYHNTYNISTDLLLFRLKRRYEIEKKYLNENDCHIDFEIWWNELENKRKRLENEIYNIKLEKYVEETKSKTLEEAVEDELENDSQYCCAPLSMTYN